jgi:hypothetical protein
MGGVGKHAGAVRSRTPWRRVVLLGLGVLAAVVAWAVLVMGAIHFGGDARNGNPEGWAFLAVATLGAVGCLFLGLIVGGKLVSVLRPAVETPRVAGGRRASR